MKYCQNLCPKPRGLGGHL